MGRMLVTGGAGFIGSHLSRRLIGLGHEVWVVDDFSTGRRDNLPPAPRLLEGDVADPGLLSRLPAVRFDAVLHLAAQSSGEASHDAPVRDIDSNIKGTLALLEWCQRRGIPRFLYASSMAVYGNPRVLPVREDGLCVPASYYGVTKLAAEHYVRLFSAAGIRTTVFRMFSVYGPGQNLDNLKQGMVSIYLAYVAGGLPILVRGSRERFRDFVFIEDMVDAWIAALDAPVAFGKIYNLGTGRRTTVAELLETLLRAWGLDPSDYPIEVGPPTPGDQWGMTADIGAIVADLGWRPRVDLGEGIERMVSWVRSRHASQEAECRTD